MSFSDGPTLNPKRIFGCLALGAIIALVVVTLFFGAALGDCPVNDDGTGCENDGIKRFLMFPGALIVAIPAWFMLARWAMRDD